jgi:hypothetical protein
MSVYTAIAMAYKFKLEGQEVIDYCVECGFERMIAVAAHRKVLVMQG